LVFATGILLGACAATSPPTRILYAGYDARALATEPVSARLSGAKIGVEERRAEWRVSPFVEGGYLVAPAEELEVFAFTGGIRVPAFSRGPLHGGGLGIVDVQIANLERFRNPNPLFGLGLGGFLEVRVASRVALGVSATANAFFDGTPPTTCNDGSSSWSTGQGTCSWHDGIAHYNDELGSGVVLDVLLRIGVVLGAADRQ
jgi:hypothetical protein